MEAKTREMDSDSEDEVFFGQTTDKELAGRKAICPRRKTIFYRRDSMVAFQNQEKSSNVLRDSMGNLFIQDSFDTDEEKTSSHKTSEESGTFESCKSSVASSLYETAAESLATSEEYSYGRVKAFPGRGKMSGGSEMSTSYYETAPEIETSSQIYESFRFSHCDKITLRKTNTTFDFQDVKESDSSAEPSELQSDLEVSLVVSESSNSEISADSSTLETKDMESSDESAQTKEMSDKGDRVDKFESENCEIEENDEIVDENDEIIDVIGQIKVKNCEIGDEIEENDEISDEIEENDEIVDENDEIIDVIGQIKVKNCEIGDEIEEDDELIDGIDEIIDGIGEIKMENCDSSADFISCTTQDVDSRPGSARAGISEEFMPIEIEFMKNENFKFIDTTLGDVTQDLSIASETSDSAEQIIHMTSADSAYTPHTFDSIETASYYTEESLIPESRDSDYSESSENAKSRLGSRAGSGSSVYLTQDSVISESLDGHDAEKSGRAENDKDCQTSFWYIAVDKKKNCFVESQQQQFDNFVVPVVPAIKPRREIRKPTNYKELSENKLTTPVFQGKTPEKKFGLFKYKNVVSPVANYIKGSTVVTPLISNVLSNSISTNQKKKPTFNSQSKIPRICQPVQPIIHRH